MKHFLQKHFFFVVLGVACVATAFFFHPYFLKGDVPFPANLLVATYSPWKYVPVPDYPNGPPNKAIGFDNVRQFYPNRQFTKEELAKWRLPLWNPYIFSGTPYIGAFDTAVFYLPSLIFQFLPLIDAWSVMVLIQPVLSVLFMYMFLRSLKIGQFASLFGAFAYAFSGWMIVYWEESLILEHSFLWLPLALFASNKIWEGKYVLGFLLLIFSLASSICAGFFQMTIYVFIAVVVWNMYLAISLRSERAWRVRAIVVGGGIVLSILISAIQLAPAVEAYLQSPRGTMSGVFLFREHLAPLEHIVTLFAPDFWGNPGSYNYFGGKAFYFEKMIYIGILPLVFVFYGFFFVKKTHLLFWKIVGFLTLLLGFSLPISWLPYTLHIPVLSSSYPTRIFALTLFSFMTICACGVDNVIKNPKDKNIYKTLAFMSVFAVGIGLFLLYKWLLVTRYSFVNDVCSTPWINRLCVDINYQNASSVNGLYATVSVRNTIIPMLFFMASWGIVWSIRYSKKIFFLLALGTVFLSSYYFSYKYTYFSERRFVYPDVPIIKKLQESSGYDRVWGYGNAFIEKNLPQYFHLFSTDGYGYLSPKWYGELLAAINNGGTLSSIIRRSDTDLFEASEKEALGKGNPYRLRMMSLLGVKYILETKKGLDKDHKPLEDRFPPELFTLVFEDETWRIWQYKEALPRAYFVSQSIVEQDQKKRIEKLYDPSVDLRHTVILNKGEPMQASQEDGSVEIIQYEPSRVSLRVQAPTNGFVFLSDTYYPGWQVMVDGKREEVLEANYAFRAVAVDAGNHTIEFVYQPRSFFIGVAISFFGLAALGIVVYSLKRME